MCDWLNRYLLIKRLFTRQNGTKTLLQLTLGNCLLKNVFPIGCGNPRKVDKPTASYAFRRQIQIKITIVMVKWATKELATSIITSFKKKK